MSSFPVLTLVNSHHQYVRDNNHYYNPILFWSKKVCMVYNTLWSSLNNRWCLLSCQFIYEAAASEANLQHSSNFFHCKSHDEGYFSVMIWKAMITRTSWNMDTHAQFTIFWVICVLHVCYTNMHLFLYVCFLDTNDHIVQCLSSLICSL